MACYTRDQQIKYETSTIKIHNKPPISISKESKCVNNRMAYMI